MNALPKPSFKLAISSTRHSRSNRRGATAVLIVSMLFVFVLVSAFTIDYAYMQLVRSELRVATDAAAKAGAEALARTEDMELAIDQAVQYAAFNRVAGNSLDVARDNVVLGRVTQGDNGRWQFQAGASPFNSVRVDSSVEPPLFFGRVLGKDSFTPTQHAVAGQQQVDICLCLDRSGSMLFDMSGADFVYPPNNPFLIDFTAWGNIWRNHLSPPHPTDSRWAVLARAVEDFFLEVQSLSPQPSVSLVSWGSDYTMPIAPNIHFTASSVDVPLSVNNSFEIQRSAVNGAITTMGNNPIMGATNLSAGLDMAVAELTGPNARTLTNKVVLLLTDGMWNDGRHPLQAGADARDLGITVHTVTMLTDYQPDIEQLAHMTGGLAYTTNDEIQLREAFREIAQSLQVVMIE